MQDTARTAIIIAAYNAAATLERAVRSALAEPETAEVCVVDDASQDSTAALAHALAAEDKRVRVIVFDRNQGPSAARNAALAATSAPWITILDADDYMLPGRLAALHAIASHADFVGDTLIRTPIGQEPVWEQRPLTPAQLTFTAFVLGNLGATTGPLDLGFMKPLMRRAFFEAHQLSYRADMRLGEDYELYARALAHNARFLVCGPAGYISVERPGSLSKEHTELDLQKLRDCDDDLAHAFTLSAPEIAALRRHWRSVDQRLQWRRLISAVKTRNAAMAFSTFHSPNAAFYLLGKLAEQAWLRGTGRGPHQLSTRPAH